jgi:hypothetical protein
MKISNFCLSYQVSATFAASLITSPAIGTYLSRFYSENFVIALATAVSVFDVFFILVAVPESLPEKLRERSKTITWDQIDPFKVGQTFLLDFFACLSYIFFKQVSSKHVCRPNCHPTMHNCFPVISARSRPIFLFFRLFEIGGWLQSAADFLFHRIYWHNVLFGPSRTDRFKPLTKLISTF